MPDYKHSISPDYVKFLLWTINIFGWRQVYNVLWSSKGCKRTSVQQKKINTSQESSPGNSGCAICAGQFHPTKYVHDEFFLQAILYTFLNFN